MLTFIEYVLGANHWRWYRKWRGGHWERCWVEPCWGSFWMRLDHDKAAASAVRRYSTVEKLLECETWG